MPASLSILYLTNVLPYPLDAGAKVRAYHTLQYLSQRHRVTLASFVRHTDTAAAREHLAAICERVVTVPLQRSRWRDLAALAGSLFNGSSFFIARDNLASMQAAVKALAGRTPFDVIHADQLSMADYGLAVRGAASGRIPKLVLDLHNAYYLIPQRMAESAGNPLVRGWLAEESRRVARHEVRMMTAYDRVVTVTGEDRAALSRLFPSRDAAPSCAVIPICMEAGSVEPVSTLTRDPSLLFVGGLHWPPNLDGVTWFAREVLPRVRAAHPSTHFTAVGKNPPRLAAQGVSLPGYVDDTTPYWQNSRAFVAPLRAGGGMRVKIVEAWARGLPVVSTAIGAEGIAHKHGDNILIADSAGAFAEAVIRVLTDDGLAARLSRRGRETVEALYDWRTAYSAWDAVYNFPADSPQTQSPLL